MHPDQNASIERNGDDKEEGEELGEAMGDALRLLLIVAYCHHILTFDVRRFFALNGRLRFLCAYGMRIVQANPRPRRVKKNEKGEKRRRKERKERREYRTTTGTTTNNTLALKRTTSSRCKSISTK